MRAEAIRRAPAPSRWAASPRADRRPGRRPRLGASPSSDDERVEATLVAVGERQRGAGLREPCGDHRAEPASRAGDRDHTAFDKTSWAHTLPLRRNDAVAWRDGRRRRRRWCRSRRRPQSRVVRDQRRVEGAVGDVLAQLPERSLSPKTTTTAPTAHSGHGRRPARSTRTPPAYQHPAGAVDERARLVAASSGGSTQSSQSSDHEPERGGTRARFVEADDSGRQQAGEAERAHRPRRRRCARRRSPRVSRARAPSENANGSSAQAAFVHRRSVASRIEGESSGAAPGRRRPARSLEPAGGGAAAAGAAGALGPPTPRP